MRYYNVIDVRLNKVIGACDEQLKEELFGKGTEFDDPDWGRIKLVKSNYSDWMLYHAYCDTLALIRNKNYFSNKNLLDSVVG